MDMTLGGFTSGVFVNLEGSNYYSAGEPYGEVTIRFRIADATGPVRLQWAGSPNVTIGTFGNGSHEIVTSPALRLIFTSATATPATASLMYFSVEHGGMIGASNNAAYTLDLGGETDTTLSRLPAGKLAVENAEVSLTGHKHVAGDVTGALAWTTTVPTTPAAAGTRGQITADGQFMYVHTGAGWKRLAFDIWV
jgi:hypothetical protein